MPHLAKPRPGSWLNPISPQAETRRIEFMPKTDDGPLVPIPDGSIIVTAQSGLEHQFLLRDAPRGWRDRASGLAISTRRGWMNFPWGSIFKWEVIHNSDAYVQAKMARDEWARAQRAAAEDETCEGERGDTDGR